MKRKVVVTGIGAVTPAGNNAREFCESLRQAKDGAAAITRFDAENFPVKTACEVKNFTLDAQTGLRRSLPFRACREFQQGRHDQP